MPSTLFLFVKGQVFQKLRESATPGTPVDAEAARPEFDKIYDAWFDRVASWVAAMGGPPGDRDDLVQDVFLVVLRRLPSFDGENIAAWLYQITRRRVRDFRRLAWFKRLLFREPRFLEAFGGTETSTDAGDLRDQRRRLDHLLDVLGEEQRAAFVLFEIEGFSGEEIASMQGVPINTVWARIHTARKKLAERLTKLDRAALRRAT
jgi:RNA polymerase sigma-70 factor (ECF subfamily)